MISDAQAFRGRHLLTYSLNVHLDYRYQRALGPWCGVIPNRLRQLESASFDRLHHGVRCLGIACHDLSAGAPRYFWTGSDQGAPLHTVVRASASIPHLFPAVPVVCDQESCRLTDGGISDPVPLAFSRCAAIGATHVIVSDCRWIGMAPATDAETVWIRPRMPNTGTLWSPRRGLLAAVRNGEAAVNEEVLARIGRWFRGHPSRVATTEAAERPGRHDAPILSFGPPSTCRTEGKSNSESSFTRVAAMTNFPTQSTDRAALVIVDCQRDFCPGGSLPARDGDRILPAINRHIAGPAISSCPFTPRVTGIRQ